jgi:hypothetical protein
MRIVPGTSGGLLCLAIVSNLLVHKLPSSRGYLGDLIPPRAGRAVFRAE